MLTTLHMVAPVSGPQSIFRQESTMKKYCLWILFITSIPLNAHAGDGGFTAGKLQALCNESAGTASDVACISYIRGFVEGWFMEQELVKKGGVPATCIPLYFDPKEARAAVEAYLRNNPNEANQRAQAIAALVTFNLYRCKN